jgi:5-methylcytosine-specific restriction endonuclease McrA
MISRNIRALVRARAREQCEYCRIRQEDLPVVTFHVEHIVPRQHGGNDDLGNLALACHHCNLHKGPNLAGIDPETGDVVPLFDPRRQPWEDHFKVEWPEIRGTTAIGRVTVRTLSMNAPTRIELRSTLRSC